MHSPSSLAVLPFERSERFDFCLFRIPETGARVLWQITNVCNYQCGYCIFSSGPRRTPGELSTEEAYTVLAALKEHGFTHLKLTGGEPFTRRDLPALLEHAEALGFESDLSTNASMITPAIAARLARLKRLAMVHVSVDGPDRALHEAARGPKTFAPTVRGLIALVRAGVPVRVGCVISAHNERALERMASFCRDAGVRELVFSLMEPMGRMAGDYSTVARRPQEELAREAAALQRRFCGTLNVQFAAARVPAEAAEGRCPGGSRFLFIDHLGRVSPCSWLPSAGRETLKTHTLEQILAGEALAGHRREVQRAFEHGQRGCPHAWRSHARAA